MQFIDLLPKFNKQERDMLQEAFRASNLNDNLGLIAILPFNQVANIYSRAPILPHGKDSARYMRLHEKLWHLAGNYPPTLGDVY